MPIYWYEFEAEQVPEELRKNEESRMVGVEMTEQVQAEFENYRWDNSYENEEGRWFDRYPPELREKAIPNWNLQRFYEDAFENVFEDTSDIF